MLHVEEAVVTVVITFIYDTLQNRTAMLLTSRCTFSPFLTCPVDILRCRSETGRLFHNRSDAAKKLVSPGHDWVSHVDDET